MNTNQPDNTKSTEELKNQVLNDIEKVKDDFREIKQRLTPGQVIDDAIFYRSKRDPGETFAHLRANPIGTTFLTLGTLLLMEDEQHRSFESLAREQATVMREKVSETTSQVGARVSETVNEAKEKLAHKKDQLKAKKDELKASIARTKEGAKSEFTIDEFTASKTDEAIDRVKEKGREALDFARDLDPMIYLALGAGLGTITGAGLPLSEKEIRAVDSASSDKMSKFANELQNALNQSVNILKNEVIGGMTDFKFDLFR
ncbi:hypothetical protein ACJVC5_10765 [Peredibacter sp. HCB2-198]|uniref:hypothetical protein n=1 Tax=Peredibacter sp. HCB2-198 TaxID=3383025 RepID=UPI0038B521FC